MVWIKKLIRKPYRELTPLCVHSMFKDDVSDYKGFHCACIINTLDKDPLNLLFYFKILYCFVHINQSDGQVVIQNMIGLCVPCGTKS